MTAEDLLRLVEKSFPCLLVADGAGLVSYASPELLRECGAEPAALVGKSLKAAVVCACEPLLASAMEDAREGATAKLTLTFATKADWPLNLSVSHSEHEGKGFYLLFGCPGNGLGAGSEWEKDERVKELWTVYAVAEWIEKSGSVREFFDGLPKYLGPGMRYPERALIYCAYRGEEYGDKDELVKCIRTELKAGESVVGEIRVGYASADLDLLPEEQKMLDEIARMLNLALERKTLREQLQQADKLASLGQLVSGIGHEINNPNQFIRGNVKIIRQALTDMLPILDAHYGANPELRIARLKYPYFREHIMTLVDDMAHGSERIKEIVEGLKRFARRDEGLLIDSVEVNTILDASRRLVDNEVHKFADIELSLAPQLPAITGNSQKIEQVLVNLLINAAQAMPEDRRGVVKASTRLEEGGVVVEVQDNGKGMDERTVKRIFEPFFTTRRAKGGTGLGLAIAYRILEEHGGSIAVTSKLDVGTTFKITLPLKLGPAAGKSSGEPRP